MTNERWSLYILECGDGTYYTGITTDLPRRLKRHQDGKASKYTRARLPVRPRFTLGGLSHSQALVLEAKIKWLRRSQKKEFMSMQGKLWDLLVLGFSPVFVTVYKE